MDNNTLVEKISFLLLVSYLVFILFVSDEWIFLCIFANSK